MSLYQPVDNTNDPLFKQTTASIDNYIDLGADINNVNKPDNRDTLVEVYGDQLISGPVGLVEMAGAVKARGYNDEVTYWEAPRLHKLQDGTITATTAGTFTAQTITATGHTCIVNDSVLINGYIRARVDAVTSTTYTVQPANEWPVTFGAGEFVKVSKYGNDHPQGSDQPTEFELSNVIRRTQPYMIFKMTYGVTGSQMGNIGWVKNLENGEYYWYQKGLQDQRKRARNFHEAMALFAVKPTNPAFDSANVNGSEGYISAIENRGTIKSGYITDISDLENLSVILDKQGAPEEYMFCGNRVQSNLFSRMIASATNQPAYGVFSNGESMAVNLGFESAKVGGRTFHMKPISVLIDPQFGGQTDYYKFFMTPMGSVADPKTGIQAPTLELNYKAYPDGEERYFEHFMLGGVNGIYTNSRDARSFEWRSEFNLVTRGANRHVVGRG